MSDWGMYIDRQIRKAIEEGDFDNLPGEGKPLNLDADEHTPEDKRLAYKILRDNDLAPDWIMQGQEIDAKINDWLTRLRRTVKNYRAAMAAPDATAATRARAARSWQTAQAKFIATAKRLNQEIAVYNLKVPPGVMHKVPLNGQREINRLMEETE